jgi:hypothetical protein
MPSARITPMPMKAQGLASYSVCGVQGRMSGFYSAQDDFTPDSFTIQTMMRSLFGRLGLTSTWSVEVAAAVLALLGGVALMPLLIFYAGVGSLGRYEGASLGHLYNNFFEGLRQGSLAAWVVLLGPYGLYLLFKGLRTWWRASARLA